MRVLFQGSKLGHIERVCLSKKKQHQGTAKPIQIVNVQEELGQREKEIFFIGEPCNKEPYQVTVNLNGKPCAMEIDSGAGSSLISRKTFAELWPSNPPRLTPCNVRFSDYQKNEIQTEGARVLFLQDYEDVFSDKLGDFHGPPIKLHLDPTVKPIALRARNVAYALRPKVEAEIDRLVAQGVLQPINNPEWTTPIVPVVKADGVSVRLCADYKCTINKALKKDPYPMPSVYEMLATLGQAKVFAKLDMAQAYQQLRVAKDTAKAQTIITHKGTFSVNRLQFGVNVAPQVFQRFINNRLAGIPGVFPYFDDILISAASREQLVNRLRSVLDRFKADGLRLKKDKCVFFATSINFLGYHIDEHGVRPTEEKIVAIKRAPKPKNKQELQSFLGLLNFYHLFLKQKADVAEPLHRLLNKDVPWVWKSEHDTAFENLKTLLTSDSLLVHFDSKKPLLLTCDASPWGVGCVLSHILADGSQAPIAYHSRTLSAAERKYSQLDREALAIVTGVRKFHNYVFAHNFQIVTDHKPLLGILGENKPIPELTSPRMARWALFLSNYDYTLTHQPGKQISHADALSRLPPQDNQDEEPEPKVGNVLMIENMPETPIKADKIAELTGKDPVLNHIRKFL